MEHPLLEASSISKTFDGVRALKEVSFHLEAGEVHAIVGENGAGKSTLIKIITGAVAADSGRLTVEGREVHRHDPALARALGIAVVYQQPALFPDLTVAENISLTLEKRRPWRRVDWKRARERAAELLARVGAEIDPQRLAGSLSMPEQQLVEIAKAIGANARILILDEPTASLTSREAERLFQVLRSLSAAGTGIVYISHRLDEVFTIADRITVLRDGETAETLAVADTDRASLIGKMVGRPIRDVFPKRDVSLGEVALELRGVSSGSSVRDVSLSVRRGEIVGLAGLVGSGRTELAETVFGLRSLGSGEILVHSQRVHVDSPAQGIEAGIGYLPEDRRRHGVVLEMPIAANTSLASLKSISHRGWLNSTRERELAESFVHRLEIKTPSVFSAAGALSGGNQQKVALARWLAVAPKVLILDEPTQGVDVAAKAEIHTLMAELAASGVPILMISSDLSEILGMSDRIAVMQSGRIAGILTRAEATQEGILSLALSQ